MNNEMYENKASASRAAALDRVRESEYYLDEQIVTDVYIDIMNENGESWEVYASDFHFCPCCSGLV